MARRNDIRSRREINDRRARHSEDLKIHEEKLRESQQDAEKVAEIYRSMELAGTEEGVSEVERSLEDAENAATSEFEEQDQNLEMVQDEGEHFSGELKEQEEATETQLETLTEVSAEIKSDGVLMEMVDGKTDTKEDQEFLQEQIDLISKEKEESERGQQDMRAQLQAKRNR